jgi:hypothetical protein
LSKIILNTNKKYLPNFKSPKKITNYWGTTAIQMLFAVAGIFLVQHFQTLIDFNLFQQVLYEAIKYGYDKS